MKIWLLTSETPLFNPGGIARYVDNFARILATSGHDVTVFGRDEEARSTTVTKGYVYEAVVPRWGRVTKDSTVAAGEHPAYPYNILDYWSAFSFQMAETVLTAIEERGQPDVIESQEYCALPYYLLQKKLLGDSRLKGIPIVVNAHSPDFIIREANEEVRYQFPHYWTGRQEMACFHAADANICPSAYLSQQLETYFGGSIEVDHYPLPWTPPKQDHLDVPIIDGKVVYFGRLEVRKGVLDLLTTCQRMWDAGETFTLHLIGSDTDYRPKGCSVGEWIHRRYTKHIETGRLVLRGSMAHSDLMGEMASAACTIIPSRWENWPNTCIEAMAHGKVVVGSRNGGQAEMIGDDARCGFVFSHDEADGLERAMRAALDLNPDERKKMGEAARRRIAAMCSPEKVLQERLQHFTSLKSTARKVFPFINRHLRDNWMQKMEVPAEETKGRVSVVIPHYNLGQYVGAAIDAALDSNWTDLEVVLVDDGSTDPHSLAVLESLESGGDCRLKIIRKQNDGLANARNTGVQAASGEFVMLLDADDAVDPTFVPRAIEILRQYENIHIVYSWEQYIQASNDIYPCWNFEFPYLLGHNMTCPISVLYRQSYLACGGSNSKMAYNFEDYELWIRMVSKGCGGVAIPEPLSFYRIREDSMWQESPREQHLHLQELIMEEHSDLFKAYGPQIFALQNANGSSQKWIKPAENSPFDTYEEWSRRRIRNLERESEKWWTKCNEADRALKASEAQREALWKEKNALLKKLENKSFSR